MARDYIGNVKQIERDLIRGDFAIKREVVYKATISKQEAEKLQLQNALATERKTSSKLSGDLAVTKQQLGEQVLKTKAARLEIWVMRVGIVIYIGSKIYGLFP